MSDESSKRAVPPYGTFMSVKEEIGNWKTHACPSVIDRSILPDSMSGATQSALLGAIRFLGMTDNKDAVTPTGKALIASHGTDKWVDELRKVVQSAYGPILWPDFTPKDASPSTLKAKFKEADVPDGQMMDKTCRFYVRIAQDAKIEVSKYLKDMKGSPRASKAPKGAAGSGEIEDDDDDRDARAGGRGAVGSGIVIPDGYSAMPIPFPGREPGTIILPTELESRDVKVIDAVIAYMRAIAAATGE